MSKKVILISGSIYTKNSLLKQIRELIPRDIKIEAYASEEGINPVLNGDLLIVSSKDMKYELDQMDVKYNFKDIIICERSINFGYIDQVADLPVNQEVLLVNDQKETTESAINDLIEIGLNHVKYYPYYPGITDYKELEIAITPGEPDKVPPCVNRTINLGPRIIDINTLYNIVEKLNLYNMDTSLFTKGYMKKIINVSQRISGINNKVSTLNNYLNNIVDSLSKGILVYDEDGHIKYANEEVRGIFFKGSKDIENKNIKSIFDAEMLQYFLSTEAYENKMINIMHRSLKISKFYIPNSKNIVVTTDREDQDAVRRNYNEDHLLQGHIARYDFEDIIGESSVLNDTKDIAFKLSKSELTVLIEGESGTGKELFASAIHNNSKRKYGPYLAVNFSALPDDLIESELFGYEEGAFTGAKKGGKVGLFELADGGTIFLDEIGDISPKVQTRLLRVLQEKEVMPLGGSTIKRVNLRIIAATNKNLKEMVLKKEFRSDLYYRLKIGYINLPPLRMRINDIEQLVAYFIKSETKKDIKISPSVLEEFKKYKWLGNIRELESTIKYMLAVRTKDILTLADLPDRRFFEEDMNDLSVSHPKDFEYYKLSDEMELVLESIDLLYANNIIAGRKNITDRLNELGYSLTQSQVRTRIENLEIEGFISREEGKYGAILTQKGLDYLERYLR